MVVWRREWRGRDEAQAGRSFDSTSGPVASKAGLFAGKGSARAEQQPADAPHRTCWAECSPALAGTWRGGRAARKGCGQVPRWWGGATAQHGAGRR